jgi:hypothetical protein
MSEAEAAKWARERGKRVLEHGGRRWERVRAGFYQPVHLLRPVAASASLRPARNCWGSRAVVDDDASADASLAVYLLESLSGYDEAALSRSRRANLRRARRAAHFASLDDDRPLQLEGYEVMRSALARTKHRRPPTPDEYRRSVRSLRVGRQCTVVGARIDGRLVGYIACHVIEGTSYGEDFHVASEALPANVATGLVFELAQVLRRSGAVHRITNGLVAEELQGLDSFKESMGFRPVSFPARVHLTAVADRVLRRWSPERHGRLTGRPRSDGVLPRT